MSGNVITSHKAFDKNMKCRGIVYCQDKDTKEPVWIEPWSDECCSWWQVSRVPKFYKDKSLVRKVIC